MPKGAIPAAALLAMDAANRQAQYLHLQFWVRVDLGIVQRKLVLRALEDSFTEELLQAGVAEAVAAGRNLHGLTHGLPAQRAKQPPLGLLQELVVEAGHGGRHNKPLT